MTYDKTLSDKVNQQEIRANYQVSATWRTWLQRRTYSATTIR